MIDLDSTRNLNHSLIEKLVENQLLPCESAKIGKYSDVSA
jgi:hypothetical protein